MRSRRLLLARSTSQRSWVDATVVRLADPDLLELRAPEVAVLLSDHRMPGDDGVRLLTQVRERHPHIVRLLFTAYADKDMALAAVNLGQVQRILEKPLD